MKQYRLPAALLCLLLVVSLLSTTALAYGRIETGRDVSLTISYEDSNVTFSIYRVASIDETVHFTLTGSFQPYDYLQPRLDESDWDSLVLLLKSLVVSQKIEPTASGMTDRYGELTFSNLKTGLYLVIGKPYMRNGVFCTPQASLVSLPNLEDDQWLYDVTIHAKPPHPETEHTDLKVQKIWIDEGYKDQRPTQITVNLYRNGKLYDTVVLKESNNWRHTWTNLPPGDWIVWEADVPERYHPEPFWDGNTFYIVNTYEEPPDNPINPTNPDKPGGNLPQTGLLWWPIPLLTLGGILLFLIGWCKAKKQGDAHETET